MEAVLERLHAEHHRCGELRYDAFVRICELRAVPRDDYGRLIGLLADADIALKDDKSSSPDQTPPQPRGRVRARKDGFATYLERIGRHQLLSPHEEVLLGRRIKPARSILLRELSEGEREPMISAFNERASMRSPAEQRVMNRGAIAQTKLFESNLRLVVSIAKKQRLDGTLRTIDDLCQAGNIGLMRAVQKFDHALGYRFSTYATHWIRQSIQRYVSANRRSVSGPSDLDNRMSAIAKATENFIAANHCEPTDQALAAFMQLDLAHIIACKQLAVEPLRLDAPIGDQTNLGDMLADPHAISPEDLVVDSMARAELHALMENSLSDRELEMVASRYQFAGRKLSYREIGEDTGVTAEAARRFHKRTMKRLKSSESLVDSCRELART